MRMITVEEELEQIKAILQAANIELEVRARSKIEPRYHQLNKILSGCVYVRPLQML